MKEPFLKATASQTVGPFLHLGLAWLTVPHLVPPGSPGAVTLSGRVLDGAGEAVPDALVEIWQADSRGIFGAQPGSDWGGFGRRPTDAKGAFAFTTVKPGALTGPEGEEAPHIDVSVFARGLLQRLVTRIYFPDEAERNARDPILLRVDPARRATLLARGEGGALRFDIHLQGPEETVFFAY